MLEEIREQSGHWIIKIIFGIIVLAFVFTFWGSGSGKMGNDEGTYAARVNGREIPLTSFERDYKAKQDQHRQQKSALPQISVDKYITQQVMDDLIEEELVLE